MASFKVEFNEYDVLWIRAYWLLTGISYERLARAYNAAAINGHSITSVGMERMLKGALTSISTVGNGSSFKGTWGHVPLVKSAVLAANHEVMVRDWMHDTYDIAANDAVQLPTYLTNPTHRFGCGFSSDWLNQYVGMDSGVKYPYTHSGNVSRMRAIEAEARAAEPTAAEPTAAEPTAAEPTAAEPTAAEPTAAEPTGVSRKAKRKAKAA